MARSNGGDLVVAPRKVPQVLLLSLLPISLWLIVRALITPALPLPALVSSLGVSILAGIVVTYVIPPLGPNFVRAGLKGRDLLKPKNEEFVPESIGLVCAAVYIMTIILFIPFLFSDAFTAKVASHHLEGLAGGEFPIQKLAVYLAAVLSLLIATLLGFLDDIFDIRWRHKLPIPLIGSIPILMVYFAEQGNTDVVMPIPLRRFFGQIIHLGPLYYLYMALLSTFTTNSINILAGINGCEVSQAFIIALSVTLNDVLYLPWSFHIPVPFLGADFVIGGVYGAGLAHGSKELVERHLLSLYLLLPLIGVCAGFMFHNWYPARAFPGDTLCYLTGMAFAVVGIVGHFSKTLLLFFMPQIFNFILSCPQLFGLVPCPRHRVPNVDNLTLLLHPSEANKDQPFPENLSRLSVLVLKILSYLRLTKLTVNPTTGSITSCTNLTILNVLLLVFGPTREESLTRRLIAVQICGSILAFGIRYGLAGLVYDGDRR
ncbi:UDP-N-acetylglucosamine-dolichyl [Sistotremastrum suecicum HHB10207 ss-3]|uniref:UDP-N-acetylglucosamine--dolichyl-phosphate N-acetylglucosaminephosphotransferase n=1 Tax=Sistotremastrum suecicum HHB10207 ss-3 TaxID=1314776 RepID=A0A166HFN9_9AGAM|nr:UDP-N-acetylglucosamine-dolichyl [Sistotremastrum suecicum HHB10207 ss-3]